MEFKGLLCIDCWESSHLDKYYAQLEDKINFSNLESIIVANYELALDSINDLSQYNTLEEYSWTNFNQDILLSMAREARVRTTSDTLKKYFNKHTFLILSMSGLIHHLNNVVPHIKDWLVIGGSFGDCTHHRPVNFSELTKLPYNFYASSWSLYKDDNSLIDFDNDSLSWTFEENGFYRLGK